MNEDLCWRGGQSRGTIPPLQPMLMPTDEALEPIARRYCELMGLDPDAVVTVPNPPPISGNIVLDVYFEPSKVPAWQTVLPIVRQHAALSIAFGGE